MRRSLAGRLAASLALVSLVVFATIGFMLHAGFDSRLTRADHEQLLSKSRLIVQLMQESRADGSPGSATRRVDDMMRGNDELTLTWLSAPQSGPLGETTPAAPYRRTGGDGKVRDAVDIPLGDGSDLHARLEIDTHNREARLRRYATILLIAGLCGVLLTSLLGGLAAHWVSGNLRRLSAEARAIPVGGRLDVRHVDDELGDLVAAFNAALAKLDTAYRQMEGFGADVAHELRSPLATAINVAQVTLSAPRSADVLRDALASNLEELERVAGIVNDMLFLARADQGERARSLERVDLGQLVDGVIGYCSPVMDEAGARVTREGRATVVCNAALMRRAIANLLTNAIRHASGDRHVVVRLDALPGMVRVAVFNPGEPISEDVAVRMFDRFYRADTARSSQGDRHGLGLAIVRAVARMHGGRVWSEGVAGGTRVGIELPGALAAEQQRTRVI